MAAFKDQVSQLFNFSQKFDINLLDQIVGYMYNEIGDQQKLAENILKDFKKHPEAWTRVDTILEFSKNEETKYFALQILENVITTRWKVLPRNQCDGIKNYIVGLIIKTCYNFEKTEKKKVYLAKLNMILVQILKREWPKNWPTFISDIVGSSKTNESLCENNMAILRLLSEEIFDFSRGQITQHKAKHLKDKMCGEFSQIFYLCQFILNNSQNESLVESTLQTLLRFLNWIPLGYIFQTTLISTIIYRFLNVPVFRNVTLKCLTEIANITAPKYNEMYILLFTQTMTQLQQMLPINTNIIEGYANGQDSEQNFILNLSMFLSTFLKQHLNLIKSKLDLRDTLKAALQYLLLISEVDEIEIFKICLEFWNDFVAKLYQANCSPTPRNEFYDTILSEIRCIMIKRMVKPEEVLVVENELGEIVREFMKDADSINVYKTMRETLVYLTHLNRVETMRVLNEKLESLLNESDWSWKNLNSLCWAIGSVIGALSLKDEGDLLISVTLILTELSEKKIGRNNLAIISSNLMYVFGQCHRFLKIDVKLRRTVVNILLSEYMNLSLDGVQDMACDTFLKIALKCRLQFSLKDVEEILNCLEIAIRKLQPQQIHIFYNAIGHLISAQCDENIQKELIDKLMLPPNKAWDDIMYEAVEKVEIFENQDVLNQLINILKTNLSACEAVGHRFATQLGRFYLDVLNVYKIMSVYIAAAIALNGECVAKQQLIKCMINVRKEILKLISLWMSRSRDDQMVLDNFIPYLLDAVLLDYKTTVPSAREPEVLNVMAAIVNSLQDEICSEIVKIFDNVFECTLNMINKDFEQFPEHRKNFYLFLQAVNNNCFSAVLNLSHVQFKFVFDSIIWALKHTMRDVAEIGLDILNQMLENFAQHQTAAQSFYQDYYVDIIRHVFLTVTDTLHAVRLKSHAKILAYMFSLVENGDITISLNPADLVNPAGNVNYIQEYVAELLKFLFSHLSNAQIKMIVEGLFNFNQDNSAFKEHLRDFLVQIREFAGEDDSELYLEEREDALRRAQEEKKKIQMTVPGILSPCEI